MRFADDDTSQRDPGAGERRGAGPVGEEGEALRAEGPSSTSPSSPPPAPATPDGETGSSRSGGDGEGVDGGGEVQEDLAALLAEAETKRDEYLELARRAQADFENYRKRMAAEVQAAAVRGKVQAVGDVVPVLDDLERALQAAGLDPDGDSEDGLAHGVILVFRNLRETLKRHGIEAVDPKGAKFDPTQHEALSTMAVEGVESGVVVEVMQKGYLMDGQLIRPARVVVSA